MEAWSQVLSITLFAAAIRSATPILYPALAGIFSERSGVLNIALEGIMLISAFAAVVGSYYTGNPWVGVLCAIAAGLLTSLIHAFMCVNMRADQARLRLRRSSTASPPMVSSTIVPGSGVTSNLATI